MARTLISPSGLMEFSRLLTRLYCDLSSVYYPHDFRIYLRAWTAASSWVINYTWDIGTSSCLLAAVLAYTYRVICLAHATSSGLFIILLFDLFRQYYSSFLPYFSFSPNSVLIDFEFRVTRDGRNSSVSQKKWKIIKNRQIRRLFKNFAKKMGLRSGNGIGLKIRNLY